MESVMDVFWQWHARHPPRLAFAATNTSEFIAWQSALRAKLRELSGLDRMDAWRCDPVSRPDGGEDLGDYVREHVQIRTAPGYWMPMYVLKPKQPGPFTPVVALHGHGRGKDDVAGVCRTDAERVSIRKTNGAFALEAVRQGFIVFVPDKRGFGERGGPGWQCGSIALHAILMGMSVLGLHTWDNMRLLDYIATRPDCRDKAVGCVGFSGGGGAALWLAALDERVRAAVISAYVGAYRKANYGCVCNAVPGLMEWADRGELAGLIAPRPVLIEAGRADRPCNSERFQPAWETLERIYALAGARERLECDLFEGGHQWSGRKAWTFLSRHLAHGNHENGGTRHNQS